MAAVPFEKVIGLSREYFKELFMPKENTFMNDVFDLTVESNRFLSLPYNFPDSEEFKKSQKHHGKILIQNKRKLNGGKIENVED